MESNETVRLALAASKIGTWELQLPSFVLVSSDQCKGNYGRSPEAPFPYEALRASIWPEYLPLVEQQIGIAVETGKAFVLEYRCTWPDGTTHWIEVNGVPVRGEDGQTTLLCGTTQEISHRKSVEHDLVETRRSTTSMLEAVDVASWSLDLINDRVTPDRNLARIFFLSDEEARGSVDNYLRRIHPEDRPMVEVAMQKVFSDPNEKYALEYRVVSPDGEERWIHIRGDVERDPAGKPILFRGVVLDINQRKQGEELERRATAQMLQAIERFRIMADSMPQMVWSAKPDGAVDYYNRRWFDYTGSTMEETQGWGWRQVQHPDDVERATERWKRSIITGGIYENEMRFLRARDKSWRWHSTRAVPIMNESGSVVQWIGTCTDINDLKVAEMALRESQEMLESRINHRTNELRQEVAERRKAENELRNLSGKLLTLQDEEQRRIARELHDSVGQYLAAALMYLGVLGREVNLSQFARKSLNEAVESVQQANKEVRVVSYLLHPPMLEEMGLAFALRFFLEGFSQRSGIETDLVMRDDFGRLPIDLETALFRVCQETLTNIHRHSGSKVAVVRLWRSSAYVELEVEDKGRGMPDTIVSGVGLTGLRERLAQFSGTTKIRSSSTGTIISAVLPLANLNLPSEFETETSSQSGA